MTMAGDELRTEPDDAQGESFSCGDKSCDVGTELCVKSVRYTRFGGPRGQGCIGAWAPGHHPSDCGHHDTTTYACKNIPAQCRDDRSCSCISERLEGRECHGSKANGFRIGFDR